MNATALADPILCLAGDLPLASLLMAGLRREERRSQFDSATAGTIVDTYATSLSADIKRATEVAQRPTCRTLRAAFEAQRHNAGLPFCDAASRAAAPPFSLLAAAPSGQGWLRVALWSSERTKRLQQRVLDCCNLYNQFKCDLIADHCLDMRLH